MSISDFPSNQMNNSMQTTAGISHSILAFRIASMKSGTDRLLFSKQIYMVRIERISVTMVQNSSFFIPDI
jgi:hypothetical protein